MGLLGAGVKAVAHLKAFSDDLNAEPRADRRALSNEMLRKLFCKSLPYGALSGIIAVVLGLLDGENFSHPSQWALWQLAITGYTGSDVIEAASDYVESFIIRRPHKLLRTRRLSIRLSEEDAAVLSEQAQKHGVSLSEIIRRLIDQSIKAK